MKPSGQSGRQTDRQTNRQTDRETDRDRQTLSPTARNSITITCIFVCSELKSVGVCFLFFCANKSIIEMLTRARLFGAQIRPSTLGVYRLVGLVVRRPPRERKIPGSNPACAGIFSGSSHTCDLNIGTPVACQAPGVIGSALGLVGPVSVYCDWVRCKV